MNKHSPSSLRIVALSCAVLAGVSVAPIVANGTATGPTIWVQSSYDDFRAGDLLSVSLDEDGDVRLAPELSLVGDTGEAYVWSVTETEDGSVFVSAGTEGKIYRFDGRAPGAGPALFFEADGTVHTMALGSDDHLYVAASPGKVWRLPIAEGGPGSSEPWLTIDARYLWALAFAPDGSLYVGTGDGGVIHRVAPDGTVTVLYDSNEAHITALAVDAAGNLLAGSSDNGHLYRISPGGDVFVLFDSPMKQITGIVPFDEGVYVAALEAGAADDKSEGGDGATPAIAGSDGDSLRGVVYLLQADGLVEEVWGSADESPHAIAPLGAGVFLGTGGSGRLFGVDPGPVTAILADLEAAQITALHARGEGLIIGTSNLGRVYRLGDGHTLSGELVSQVKDTATTSHWGRVRWRGEQPEGTSVRLYSRSGNTADPNETWSEWSGPYDDANGTRITSPAARFVQWKAELRTDRATRTPVLEWVELVYVQRNLRPEIDEFILHPAGVIYRQNSSLEDGLPIGRLPSSVREALSQQQGGSGANATGGTGFRGQAYYLPGSQTFTWDASDSNGDQLTYSLWYRGEVEAEWKPVATGMSETLYLWDTKTVPDGLYRARLTASDAPSNPSGRELTGDRSSEPFVVDNTAPRIDNLAASSESGTVHVTGEATDETSLIRAMEYAVDGGEWHAVLPADGMPDAGSEGIEFDTIEMGPGEHTIVVRVTDTALNSSTKKLVVTVR